MDIWRPGPKIGLLLVLSVFFLAHFWVPLLSVDHGLTVHNESLIPFLGGGASLNYMAVGLLPFLMSGLMLSIVPLMHPEYKEQFTRLKSILQRVLLYLLAGIYAFIVLSKQPDNCFKLGMPVAWLELMLSVWSVESLLNKVSETQLVKSPITYFLGLSVTGTFVSSLQGERDVFLMFAALATFVVSLLVYQQKRRVTGQIQHYVSGRLLSQDVVVEGRLMHIGLMPFVMFSLLTTPLLSFIDERYTSYAIAISEMPMMAVALFSLMIWLGVVLSRIYLQRSGVVEFSRFWNLRLNSERVGSSTPFSRFLTEQSFFSASVVVGMIAIQSVAYLIWGNHPMYSFAGGISWLIVAAAIFDASKGVKGAYHVTSQ